MLNRAGFVSVDASKAEQIVAAREREGWRVFRLPEGVTSKDEFFEAVRRTMPLDPEVQSNRSWDALADSLWCGVDGLSEDKIVIVWPNATAFQAHAPEDFDIASNVLMDLAVSLSNPEVTAGATKEVLVLRLV